MALIVLLPKKLGQKHSPSHTDVLNYLGHAAPGNEGETKEGKKFYYLYFWVPAVAPELGVRMMSPVGKTKTKNATEAKSYTANKESNDYFDTYITLERSTIVSKSKVTKDW